MKTIQEITGIIQDSMAGLSLKKNPNGLYEPIQYALEDGGKRLRPLLLMMSAEAFDYDANKCINQAIAIELFHNFTLLHDDIMDRAPIRHGRTTVNYKWNDNTAILSGDAMVILSYKYLSKGLDESKYCQILKVFNKAAIEVCEGQQYDMDFEKKESIAIKDYLQMIRLKTAVLLGAAAQIGAIMAGASKQDCEAIYAFGENLGIAFQIQDDLLDTYGESTVFGKKIGGDILVGKKTFLLLSALMKASKEQARILLDSRDYDTVRAIYDDLKVSEEAEAAIDAYLSVAMQYLSKCKSTYANSMINYLNLLVKRSK